MPASSSTRGPAQSICNLGSAPAETTESALLRLSANPINSWMDIPGTAVTGCTTGDVLNYFGFQDSFLEYMASRAHAVPGQPYSLDLFVNTAVDLLDTPSGEHLMTAVDWMVDPDLVQVEPETRGPFSREPELFETTDHRLRFAQRWRTKCAKPTCPQPEFVDGQMTLPDANGDWIHPPRDRLLTSRGRPLGGGYEGTCRGCSRLFTDDSWTAVNLWYANPRHLIFLQDGTPIPCDQQKDRSTCRESLTKAWSRHGRRPRLLVSS